MLLLVDRRQRLVVSLVNTVDALLAVEKRELPELVSRPANSNVLLGFVDAPVQDAPGTAALKDIRESLEPVLTMHAFL